MIVRVVVVSINIAMKARGAKKKGNSRGREPLKCTPDLVHDHEAKAERAERPDLLSVVLPKPTKRVPARPHG